MYHTIPWYVKLVNVKQTYFNIYVSHYSLISETCERETNLLSPLAFRVWPWNSGCDPETLWTRNLWPWNVWPWNLNRETCDHETNLLPPPAFRVPVWPWKKIECLAVHTIPWSVKHVNVKQTYFPPLLLGSRCDPEIQGVTLKLCDPETWTCDPETSDRKQPFVVIMKVSSKQETRALQQASVSTLYTSKQLASQQPV